MPHLSALYGVILAIFDILSVIRDADHLKRPTRVWPIFGRRALVLPRLLGSSFHVSKFCKFKALSLSSARRCKNISPCPWSRAELKGAILEVATFPFGFPKDIELMLQVDIFFMIAIYEYQYTSNIYLSLLFYQNHRRRVTA